MGDRMGTTMTDLSHRLRDRREERRVDRLDRDNARLRSELRTMRDEMEQEREQREQLTDVLRSHQQPVEVKVKTKRSGLVRGLLLGGAGYVLGTRAGRERWNQFVGWFRRLGDRVEHTGDAVEHAGDRMEHAGEPMSRSANAGPTATGRS